MKRFLLFATLLFHPLASQETMHQAHFESGSFTYSAIVDSLPVRTAKETTGAIHYIFYRKEGIEGPSERPITFCFNGGPGSSSVWLHMQAFGPKRVLSPEEGQSAGPPYLLIDNPDSILDLTDLVFIDPIGTGFSRPSDSAQEEYFYSMDGDIESLGDFLYDFITREGRWNSPKYLAGESYGGLRVCGLAEYLHSHHSLFLNGMILISPAIDFKTFRFDSRDNELAFTLYLPSFAAAAWAHGRLPHSTLEEAISEARDFALARFAPELFKKGFVPEDLYEEIAFWTGLPLSLVKKEKGLISGGTFFNYFGEEKQISRFDSRNLGERLPGCNQFEFYDPVLFQLKGIVSAALNHYLYWNLNCRQEWPRYEILSRHVNQSWSYDTFGYPSQLEALRKTLLYNSEMRIFAACGYFDLAVPFAAVEHSLNRLHLPEAKVSFGHYEGGHMFYTNPSALKKFKSDLKETVFTK